MIRCFHSRATWVAAAAALGLCSCGQHVLPETSRGSVGTRNYSDAVVHIGQVDPAYRAYFADQNAATYSLSDQRKAYLAAAQTARTPVRESDYHPGDIRKKYVSKKGKSRVAASSKSNSKVAARKPAPKKKTAVAAKKPTRKR